MEKNEKGTAWEQAWVESVLQTIKEGKIYAKVEKVSSSGMSRWISFYRVTPGDTIQNCTAAVAWLRGHAKIGVYHKNGKYFIEDGMRVSGCGMDMVFHTLYCCLPSEDRDGWSQHYGSL